MTTIIASSTIGIYLSSSSYTNPVVIDADAVLTGDFRGYEIYGNLATWTFIPMPAASRDANTGVGGIHLQAGGAVTNQGGGVISLTASSPSAIYIVGGGGTVDNAGIINAGVWLQSGGTVTNETGGTIVSSSTSGYGVGLHAGGLSDQRWPDQRLRLWH